MDSQMTVSRAVELANPAFAATRALALTPDLGVLCFDADMIVRSMQGSVFSRFGWSLEGLVGRLLPDALRAAGLTACRPYCDRALQGEAGTFSVPSVAGGARLQISVDPVHVHDGTIVGGIAIARQTEMNGVANQATLSILPGVGGRRVHT